MARVKRQKRRRLKSVKERLTEWLQDKLEGDQWADFSYRDIEKETQVSHQAAYAEVLRLVAGRTGRTIEEVRAVRRDRSIRHHATPLAIYSIQELREKGWKLKAIANLVGLSQGSVRKYIGSPNVELPSDTAGREISDELRQVLADELRIGISSDGTTHKLDEASPAAEDDEESQETSHDDLEAEVSEPGTTPLPATEITPPASEETPQQDRALVKNSGAPSISTAGDPPTQPSGVPADRFEIDAAPRENVSSTTINTDTRHPLSNRPSSVPHDKDAQLPGIVIYIAQQLYSKGYSIDGILREEKLNLTKAQVLKCLDYRTVGLPDHIDPYYESVTSIVPHNTRAS